MPTREHTLNFIHEWIDALETELKIANIDEIRTIELYSQIQTLKIVLNILDKEES